MTKEQRRISNKNYKNAAKILNLQEGYVLHHINKEWRHSDIDRYIQWNVDDLVVMTKSEHVKLHNTGEGNGMYNSKRYGELNPMYGKSHKPESKEKISKTCIEKGSHAGKNNGNYGSKTNHWTEESKAKRRETVKGRKWKLVNGRRVYYYGINFDKNK